MPRDRQEPSAGPFPKPEVAPYSADAEAVQAEKAERSGPSDPRQGGGGAYAAAGAGAGAIAQSRHRQRHRRVGAQTGIRPPADNSFDRRADNAAEYKGRKSTKAKGFG